MADAVRRGDVFLADVAVEAKGGHKKQRPLLVVQNDKLSPWKTVRVVPLSSDSIGNASADRFTVELLKERNNFLDHTSYAQCATTPGGAWRLPRRCCARLGSVKRDELKKRIGTLNPEDLITVELRLQAVLGIVP